MTRKNDRLMKYNEYIYVDISEWSKFLRKTGMIAYSGWELLLIFEEERIANPHTERYFVLRNASLKTIS